MKTLLPVFALCVIASIPSQAQFPIQLGSVGQEYGKCMVADHDGNIITGLLFQNTIDFDPGPNTATRGTPPGIDIAIAKYDKLGNFIFAKNISGIATPPSSTAVCTPHGIAVDQTNNIYLIGYFGVTSSNFPCVVDFDPNVGTAYVTNSGGWDPFIAKYDANGNYLWARALTSVTNSSGDERAWDLAVDASGNVYVTGFIQGSFDLDASASGSNIWSSAGEKDIFLVKYDANGNHLWGFVLNDVGDSASSLKESSVTLDDSGHVFLMGHFNGTMDVDPSGSVSNLTSAGGSDMFIARYSTNGNFEKVIRIGGTQNEVAPPGTLRTDKAGNLYMTARFRGQIDLDPGVGVFNVQNLGTGINDDIFVATYDNNLNFRWGFSLQSDGGMDGGHRVALDSKTNLYVTGWFSGSTDFDGGTNVFNLTSANGTNAASDNFLAKYDRNGNFLWVEAFGSVLTTNLQTDLSIPAGLAIDLEDNAYITGQFYGTNANFYPNAGPTLSSVGQNDCFILKFTTGGFVSRGALSINSISTAGSNISITWSGGAGIRLQKTGMLSFPNWQDVPSTLGQNSFWEIISTNTFYRLSQP